MRITIDQTESSVLSLGGVPVGLGESLQPAEILRNTLNTILRIGLVFVVAVLNSPLGVLLIVELSWGVSNDGSGDNILPLLYLTLGSELIELKALLDLEGIVSHLVEETRGTSGIRSSELVVSAERKIRFASVNSLRVVVDVL